MSPDSQVPTGFLLLVYPTLSELPHSLRAAMKLWGWEHIFTHSGRLVSKGLPAISILKAFSPAAVLSCSCGQFRALDGFFIGGNLTRTHLMDLRGAKCGKLANTCMANSWACPPLSPSLSLSRSSSDSVICSSFACPPALHSPTVSPCTQKLEFSFRTLIWPCSGRERTE